MPGQSPPNLPGFTFVQPIGQGGFADVFLYEQRLPNRRVAVKVLKRGADGARLDMFHAEANVMAQLSSHPSIMPIYQADVSAEGHPYLVMEYCPGPHLAQRFRRERLPVGEVLEMAVKVASAVETAHRAGILHRDIKPHNILINAYGAPLLTDFGIATAVGDTGQAEHGMSIPWSAPEVLADAPSADVRSDVFSLAATVYSLVAGRSPFEVPGGANDSVALIDRIERNQPVRLMRPDMPDRLNDVLVRGMAKRPDDRPQSAMAFARELQEVEIEMRRTPTRLEVLDAGPSVSHGASNDDRTMIKPISVIVPEEFHPTARPRRVDAGPAQADQAPEETVLQRRFQPAPAGLAGQGPALTPGGPAVHSRSRPRAVSVPEEQRRSPWIAVLIAVVVLAVAAFGVISMLTGGREGPGEGPTRIAEPTIDTAARPAPAPALAHATTPTGVRFTWTNSAPEDGDVYKIVRTRDGELLPEVRRAATSLDFALRPGQSGCITVTVVRKNLTQRGEPTPNTCVSR